MTVKRKRPDKPEKRERDYQQVFMTAPIPLVILSMKGDLIDFNDAFRDLFGFTSREELINENLSCLCTDSSAWNGFLNRLKEAAVPEECPLEFRRKDLSIFPALIATSVVRDRTGEITQYLGAIRDLSASEGEKKNLVQKTEDLTTANEELRKNARILQIQVENLTEHEGARERALQEMEEQNILLSGIISNTICDIFSTDRQYHYTSYNQQHAETMRSLFGTSIGAGKSILDCISIEKDRNLVKSMLDRALGGESIAVEGYLGDHALKRQYRDFSSTPLRNSSGNVTGVATIAFDATERKRAEKALRAGEERYRRFMENSRDIIFHLLLPDMRFEYISPAVRGLTGYPPEDFYQNPTLLQDIIHPDFRHALATQRERMRKGDIPEEYEYRIIHKSGEPRWFNQRNAIIRDNAGRIVALEGIVTDITARKSAEIARKQIEERYRIISENTGDVIWLLDLETMKFSFISPSVYRLLGYTAEEMMSISLQDILTPESLRLITGSLPAAQDAFRSGDESPRIQQHRLDQVRKDGSIVTVEIVTTLLPAPGGGGMVVLGVARDISEKERDQEALRESEEKFRTLVETTSDLVWEIDTAGVYTYISPRVTAMMGYEPDELIGKSAFSIMTPDDAERMMVQFNEFVAGMLPVPGIINRCRCKDGSIVILETSAVPRFGKDGSFAGYRGIDRDVTQRISAQNAVRESEERYRTVIESANEAIFVIQDGRIPFVNKKGLELIGYDSEYLRTHSFLDLLRPEDRAAALDRHIRRLRGERQDPLAEIQITDRSGAVHWMEINAVPILWETRAATLNFASDITLRKAVDQALRESEHHYHLLADNVQDVIWTADRDMQITYVSPSIQGLLGYSPEEFLSMSPQDCLTPASFQKLMESRQVCLTLIDAGHIDAIRPQTLELEYRCKDNTTIWAEVLISLIHSERGEPRGVIGVTRDITDRKLAEDALRNSETYLMAIINSVQTGLVVVDPATCRIIDINPAASAMIGSPRETTIGADCRQFLCLEDRESCPVQNPGCAADNTECTLMSIHGPKSVLKTVSPIEFSGTRYLLESFIDITDRKEAERALIESEVKFRELIEHSTDVVYTIDFSGVLTSISPAVSRIMGYCPEELIGENIRDYLTPESFERATSEIQQKSEHPDTSSLYEVFLRAKDGKYIPFEVNSRIRMRNGKPYDILGIARDISERKLTEDALKNSEEYLQTIINSVQTGLVVIDAETHTIIDINPAAERIIGEPRERIIGSVCHRFICPAESAKCPVTDLGATVDNSERTLMSSRGERSILKTVVPITLSGKPFLLESFIDITDRKHAEAKLAESEEKFHLIFKNSNDAIYLFEITPSGMPGRIVDANDVALLQTGYSIESLLKKNFLDIHTQDLSRKSRSIMMELLTKGEVRFDTEVSRQDSSLLAVEVSAQFARFNQRTYVIAISRDMSRRKREERALRIANQKLQLMNIVAWHDIQNKVTGLRSYVELSKDLVTDDQLKRFIRSEEEVLKVIHLQIQYTKEYQEMGIHPQEWINLHQTLRMILPLADLGTIRVILEVENLEIFCDPIIAKVFSHLLDNTRIHGQKATEVHIRYAESGDGLVLVYEDDGVGIPDEKKKELFLRNFSTSPAFSLFFIHDLLEISEMTIRETGLFGEGARFEIRIPKGIYRFTRPGA